MMVQIRVHVSQHEQLHGTIGRPGAAPTAFAGWHNLVALLEQLRAEPARHDDQPTSRLTAREQTVLAHVARGLSDQAIAQALGVSHKTIASHVSNAMRKLELPRGEGYNRRVLATIAYLRGTPLRGQPEKERIGA